MERRIKRKLSKINSESVSSIPHEGETILAKVYDVYDGDTCKIIFLHGNKIPMKISIRIMGIDTPERRGKNITDLEKEVALIVRDKVIEWIDGKIVKITFLKWDKYGGRIDGNIFFDDRSVGEELIKLGFAKIYHGKKKKKWTQEELLQIKICK